VTDDAKNFSNVPRPTTSASDRYSALDRTRGSDALQLSSGHSTRATVFAGLLAELFARAARTIITTGRECGWLACWAASLPDRHLRRRVLRAGDRLGVIEKSGVSTRFLPA